MMTTPLDEKGMEAAEAAWHQTDMGLRCKLSDAIRAYRSTAPATDGLAAKLRERSGFVREAGHNDDADLDEEAADALEQAQSALAAVREDIQRLSGQLDASQTTALMLSSVIDRCRKDASTAEAEVKRLTEANEALRRVLERAGHFVNEHYAPAIDSEHDLMANIHATLNSREKVE